MEVVMQVTIGIDPHKATHTAVAVNSSEDELSRLKVRATRAQVDKLLTWAAPFASRTWAIEGAEGLGFLLAQQLVARGEHVVDVPASDPTPASTPLSRAYFAAPTSPLERHS